MSKTNPGNFFEDFRVGQEIRHATPRTLTEGDASLYTALYGSRFALQSSDAFAQAVGFARAPLDDLLVFHTVFGKTVPDISLNAVANLGYADCVFGAPVFPGDSLTARSEVIGLRENANGKTGIVYVRTTGENQHGKTVLGYVRWVMVRKRDPDAPAPEPAAPDLPKSVAAGKLAPLAGFDASRWDDALSGEPWRWGDYAPGEKIDHIDGMTIEEAEHATATRLYQNTAKVHFNRHTEAQGRFRPAAGLRRPCHQSRPSAQLQRPRQRLPDRRDQRRTACQSGVRRRYDLCLVGNRRTPGSAGQHGAGRAQAAHDGDQGRALRCFPGQERGRPLS